ncbi:MAG: DNA polymerase III subunit beta [Bifidobacteriaceae bacterium]|nr:DNA polymerase III subunit beta [Bifidobacteriaceae bacterium]
MKVEVNSADFADAVNWTTHIIPTRPAMPILQGVKIDAAEGTMNLSAFDYDVTDRHHIEADVDEPGTIVVLGKLLADISKNLPAEKTTLATEGTRLLIRSGKARFSLQLMPESDYPQLPEVPQVLGRVDGETFAHAVNQAAVSVAKEDSRPILAAILMEFHGDKVTMISTDRFRLSQITFSWTPENPDVETKAQVRGTLLQGIARFVDTTQNVTLDFDPESQRLLGIENAGRISTTQLVEGDFPAVHSLFRDEYPIQAVVNRQELLDALHRVTLVAERNSTIRCRFTQDDLMLSAGAADESQASESIAVDLDGGDITVAFNPRYLEEGLKAFDEPYVRIKMTDALKAVEINGQQEADSDESLDFRYLLVPVRFTE